MAKDDNTFMKGVQERIGIDKYIRGVGEIDYQRRTGKDDGDTSMFTPEELMRLIAIRERQDAKLKKEIEDKELKEAVTKKQSKGGSMTKQMELFNEGGLKEEGGTVDPVSGNDVPIGSTKEEVRDDIPAQLSEGEFVFPADVVRYIGLEKLMKLRQDAKQGLKAMEDMGQMGNSDEATMPDDLPFDMTDLDIEDEIEYNRGGVVKAQQGTYVAPTVPTQYRNESIDTTSPMGMQQIQSGLNTGVTTQAPYTPNLGQLYAPQTQPYAPVTYTQFLGPSAAGAPQTETVRYFNEATGQTRMIPHVVNPDGSRGATLYPVPEGFVIQEEAPKEEAKKTQVASAKVKPVDTGDGGDSGGPTTSAVDPVGDPLSYQSLFNMDALDKNLANLGKMQLGGFNVYSNIASGVTGKANVNALSTGAITSAYTTAKNNLNLKGTNIGTINNSSIRDMLNNAIETAKVAVRDVSVDDEGNALSQDQVEKNINALAKAYGVDALDKSKLGRNFNLDVQLGKKLAEVIEARQKDIEDRESRGIETGTTPETSLGIEGLSMAQQQGIQDALSGTGSGSLSPSVGTGVTTGPGFGTVTPDESNQPSGEDDDPGGVDASNPSSSDMGYGFKQGGLAKRKPKVKKMKRGGLASRK